MLGKVNNNDLMKDKKNSKPMMSYPPSLCSVSAVRSYQHRQKNNQQREKIGRFVAYSLIRQGPTVTL